MGLFSRKPKMQTIVEMGHTFEYMEFVKGYPLPDDVNILENMVIFYREHSHYNPAKSSIREGYIHKADYHDILIKYFQLGGKMDMDTLNDMRNVSAIMVNYGTNKYYNSFAYWLNPETLENKTLGIQLQKKMIEQYMAWPFEVLPQMKLSLACMYLNKYPDSFDYITSLMKKAAREEMALGKDSEYFEPGNLSTTAVLEYLEHDWPAFYEAEFGYMPEGAPETVSGILKKYNLTPAQYYEKAAKGGGGKSSMHKSVHITPACVINELFRGGQSARGYAGDIDEVITRFNTLLSHDVKEAYEYGKADLLASSCMHHMFADIGLAAFMLDEFNFPDSLPAFGGTINLKKNSKDELTTYKTSGSLSQHRIAEAGYARMMQRHGFLESTYKSYAMYGELTFSEVYKLADRANDLKFRTRAEKSVLFEPEI